MIECPLLAQSGHSNTLKRCLLFAGKADMTRTRVRLSIADTRGPGLLPPKMSTGPYSSGGKFLI
jgi:hypothetical protein